MVCEEAAPDAPDDYKKLEHDTESKNTTDMEDARSSGNSEVNVK